MIVDPQEDQTEEISDITQQVSSEAPAVDAAPADEQLPEKYRGKSVAEIAKMHAEAEKLIVRQSQEVGEVRKLADSLIKQQIAKEAEKPRQVVEEPEVDFFENPKEAVKRTLESSPEVKELREMKRQMKAQQTAQALAAAHPDAFEIGKSADFAEWVKGSKVRLSLYAQADAEYDFDAANELLLSYKAQRGLTGKKEAPNPVGTQREALKAASVDTNGSNEGTSKKIYRRADIMRLMQTDPERYQMMQPEILAAYAERRVR